MVQSPRTAPSEKMRANWRGNGEGTAARATAQKGDGHDKRHPGENLELSLHMYQISMSHVSFPAHSTRSDSDWQSVAHISHD